MIANFRSKPDGALSIARYRALAGTYDASSRHIGRARREAIAALGLAPGATVFDVACGTGVTACMLAESVGPSGRVVGIEHSRHMLDVARARIQSARLADRITLVESSVEEAGLPGLADAVLFCYTHDVLQSPAALRTVFRHVKPGARVVVLGARFLPWWWGAPVNLWLCAHSWRYFTTFRGLDCPWRGLLAHCPDLRITRTFHLGTSYLAVGHAATAKQAPATTAHRLAG